jgi:hypothetical protein
MGGAGESALGSASRARRAAEARARRVAAHRQPPDGSPAKAAEPDVAHVPRRRRHGSGVTRLLHRADGELPRTLHGTEVGAMRGLRALARDKPAIRRIGRCVARRIPRAGDWNGSWTSRIVHALVGSAGRRVESSDPFRDWGKPCRRSAFRVIAALGLRRASRLQHRRGNESSKWTAPVPLRGAVRPAMASTTALERAQTRRIP